MERLAGDERRLVARQDQQQAAGLRPRRRDAGGEARGGQAQGRVETEAALQLVLDRFHRGHRGGCSRMLGSQVNVGFVRGRALHPSAGGQQDRRDLVAEPPVRLQVALADHRSRTEPVGRGHGLPRDDPGLARLTAGHGHQPGGLAAPHDHRPPAQRGVEAPLDVHEERVEVHVQDVSPTLLHVSSLEPGYAPAGPPLARTPQAQWSGPLAGPNDS